MPSRLLSIAPLRLAVLRPTRNLLRANQQIQTTTVFLNPYANLHGILWDPGCRIDYERTIGGKAGKLR